MKHFRIKKINVRVYESNEELVTKYLRGSLKFPNGYSIKDIDWNINEKYSNNGVHGFAEPKGRLLIIGVLKHERVDKNDLYSTIAHELGHLVDLNASIRKSIFHSKNHPDDYNKAERNANFYMNFYKLTREIGDRISKIVNN